MSKDRPVTTQDHEQSRHDDARFRDLRPADRPEFVPGRTSEERARNGTWRSAFDPAVDRITRQMLEQSATLEQSAKDILAHADRTLHHMFGSGRGRSGRPCRQEIIEGLAHRYGLLGQPPVTLETMGTTIGVTRERARQIQVKHESIPGSHQFWWPQLDHALDIARTMAPCTEAALANELVLRGLAATDYRLDSLRACAAFAGRPFDLDLVEGTVTADSAGVTAILRATRKLASRQGLASVLQISDEILNDGIVLAEDDVRALLAASSVVAWLDHEHVTWIGETRNRLVNTLRTMLSVHQPIDLVTAQKAVATFWSYRSSSRGAAQPDLTPPTAEALREFCEWHDDFAVTPSGIVATVDLDHTGELGVEAALLVDVIRSSPDDALDRISLMETAEAVGMKLSTVGVYLTFHPAFVQLDRNVWTVRGTQVRPEVVRSIQGQARSRSKSENRDFRTGVRSDGRPWVAFAVTSNFRMTGVLLRRWFPLDAPSVRLAAVDGQGDPCGTATYNSDNGFTHGLGVYVKRFDIRVGEYMQIIADMQWETTQIVHGDDSLMSGPPTYTSGPE